jgi:hypothetical protein
MLGVISQYLTSIVTYIEIGIRECLKQVYVFSLQTLDLMALSQS